MRATTASGAWLALALLAGGCTTILGIEEKDYSPADAAADATHHSDASEDRAANDEGAISDAPSDVTYAFCTTDGSTGAVCGPVVYGTWSTCSYVSTCANSGSRTRSAATPICSSGACTPMTSTVMDTSGCARNTDGTTCGTGQACNGGTCKCAPQCSGKNCGPDSCGGTCGSCSGANATCNNGVCQCTPNAGCVAGGDVGNVCAADNGCGGPCSCNTQNGESCGSNGKCCHNQSWYCSSNADCCSGSCNVGASVCN
ncbi:MAG TPA: hypothetical protein VMI75_18070 [Polyangiaceae bacterium]|nr:hypothetical protein [Polyangiaceae bacterium]